jgi:hypothetical protein
VPRPWKTGSRFGEIACASPWREFEIGLGEHVHLIRDGLSVKVRERLTCAPFV